MAPSIGEIRIFAGGFAPVGWEPCDGRELATSMYGELFNLIGTTYGGDGIATFALPDLRGRAPIHRSPGAPPGMSQSYLVGETGGVEQVTLTATQIPAHRHALLAARGGGTASSPQGRLLASPPTTAPYARETPQTALPPQSLDAVGGSQPHDNMGPSLVIEYIICVDGEIPTSS